MPTTPADMRFGVFLAPFQPDDEHPTLQIRRDLELVDHLDRLDFDEAWIGEHHSGAYEIIASPELFIAAAAERTRRIRLGTGVVSLPYHNPLTLADRIMQLDHQTQGRAIFGVGPGQLASDAFMLGIDTQRQREMMSESLEVLVPLLRGEVVTRKTSWFDLQEARLQLAPYSRPSVEMAVAASISPSGPRAAGRFGTGMLSLTASLTEGFDALPAHWAVCEQLAAEHGQTVDRASWRLVGPMHLAETREKALDEMRVGVLKLLRYMQKLGGRELPFANDPDAAIEHWTKHGLTIFGKIIVGTPDDAVAAIEQLWKQSGGFGTYLLLGHNCASPAKTLESYELFARYVVPQVRGLNRNRHASIDWAHANSERLVGAIGAAIGKAIAEHERERAQRGGKGVAWSGGFAPAGDEKR